MPGAGTDKTKRWIVAAGADRRPGRAAARREHRRGGARHGQFRACRACGWSSRCRAGRTRRRGSWRRAPTAYSMARSFMTAWPTPSAIVLSSWRRPRAITIRRNLWSARRKRRPRWRRTWRPAENVAIVFGRERNGLENHEVARADRILTLPVNPAFASLNLAQAVVIVGYEWFKQQGGELPFSDPAESRRRRPSSSSTRSLPTWSASSTRSSFSVPRKSAAPWASTCAIFSSACSRRSRTCALCTASSRRIAQGRKGPARGGVLDGAGADKLRALLGRTRRRPRALRAHAVARPAAAVAAQSDRRRARLVAGAGQRPALCRPRLQAAGADRPAYRRFRVVSAQMRDRSGAGGG